MRVTISNKIRIDEPTYEVLDWVKKGLVLPNPEYAKKKRMGFWVGETPEKLTLYETDGDSLLLPYGCKRLLGEAVLAYAKYDMPVADPVDFRGAAVPLYDYQRIAVLRMLLRGNGILVSPAGSGKTQMGIAIATQIGRKTLWLTHTRDLLTQSKQRAERYMDPSLLGTITEGKVSLGECITFATVQTMCRLDLAQYRDTWDVVIVDECHRCAGTPTAVTQFFTVLSALRARHKYGLTATAHRADGLMQAVYALIGPIEYTVPEEAVAGKIVQVTVEPISTAYELTDDCLDTDGTIIYSRLLTSLCEDEERNVFIRSWLCGSYKHYNLILSDRLEHLETLMNSLPPPLRAMAVMVSGKMTTKKGKAEREKALQDMRDGKKRYLFATYALAKEGLDIPRLDTLFLTTPQKDYAVVAQSVGRIARAFDGKDCPIVYDFVDERVGYLQKAYKKRCTTYRKLKCKFI